MRGWDPDKDTWVERIYYSGGANNLWGVLALILGVLTITGIIRLRRVYLLAFLSGSALALNAPVRQTFVAEMVGDADLPNAVALNSISINAAQMIGPAVAGFLIAKAGIG